MDKNLFAGAGGGPSAPTQVDDNLKSEDIIEFALAVSEGPIRGLAEGAKSFMVGDTPLVSPSGTRNFDKFAIGVHPGYPDGSARPLDLKLGGVSSSTAVSVSMMQNVSITRQTSSTLRNSIDQLEVRILFARLVKVKSDGGTTYNTARFTLEYKQSSSTEWLPFVGSFSATGITGKTSGGTIKEFRKDVPRIQDDWDIRVMKLSPDGDTSDVVELQWESFQCTNKEKLTYPDTAIVHGLGVANGQFSSIPEFSGVYDGLIVRVPTNYNPDLRLYDDSVPWDGSFKFAWTNNGVWILYDLITNPRYGLAKHRRYIDANRFVFYEAARWCDEPVRVGDTDQMRPRFTFNDLILEPRPAMEQLQYVAGSFNGLVWDDLQGQIHLRVDKDDPAVQMFTPENVTAEGFNYTFTDITARANDISVTFINPDLDWAEDSRRIPNVTTSEDDIAKNGRIPLDFIAVGCTNIHEAVSRAQVRLISALTETTMVSFDTARQGALLSLYDVILIADPDMGWSTSGRLTTYDEDFINFRDPIYIETLKTYTVKIQTQTGILDVDVEPEQIGHLTRLRLVGAPLPDNLPRYAVFTLEEPNQGFGLGKPFRVMALEEVDGSPYVFKVSAMEINRNKYVLSESGTPITEPQYSYQQPFLPGQPSNFKAQSGDDQLLVLPTGEVLSRILTTWRKPFGSVVSGYVLQYKLADDEAWQTLHPSGTEQYIVPVTPGAHYSLRVASIDPAGNASAWATINDYVVIGKQKVPANVTLFNVTSGIFQLLLSWTYSPATDTRLIEIWGSTVNTLASAVKLSELAYPTNNWTHLALNAGVQIFYWVRVKDTSGNFSPFSTPKSATTSTDPSAILAILQGKISATQLANDLTTRIDLIDGPSPTSIFSKLQAEILSGASTATQVTQLNSTVAGNSAAILAINNISAGSSSASAQQLASVTATVNNAQTGVAASAAAITAINNVSAGSTSANAQALASVKAQVNDVNTGLPVAIAGVAALNDVSATSGSAAARLVYNVYSRINGSANSGISMEQQFQTQASVNSGLYGQYSIKIDANGYIAGFGLSVYPSGDTGHSSAFIIRADQFAFGLPGQVTRFPFVAGVVNGIQTVGINGALVIDGTLVVREANIENLSVSTLKIGGEAVTTTKIGNEAVNIPRYTEGNGGYALFGAYAPVVGSIIVNIPENVATNFVFLINWDADVMDGANTGVYLDYNGNNFAHLSRSGFAERRTSHTGTARVYLGPGTYTFNIRFQNESINQVWSLGYWSMTLLASKR